MSGVAPTNNGQIIPSLTNKFLTVLDVFADFIASGLQWTVPSSASLTTSMSGGVAYIGGTRTPVSAINNNAFPASNDTYVSINNAGDVNFQSVANGATAPTPVAGYVQTAKVVTSPIVSPVPLLAAAGSGSLAAGTYEIALVAHDATGYGLPSAAVSVTVAASGSIVINWLPALNETSVDIYATVAGGTTLGLVESGVTGSTYTYTGAASPGAAPPSSATSNAIQSISRLLAIIPYNSTQTLLTPEMFGATGLGFPYDDSEAINNALAQAQANGGGFVLCAKTYYCNNNITIPPGCSLRGIYGPRPSPNASNNLNYPSEIVFGGTFGVLQGYSSHIGGLILFSLEAQQSPTGTAAFSGGTAISGDGAIDASCIDCGIFGFNQAAFYSNNPGRVTVDGVFFDCQSGIEINGALDICQIRNCHGWDQLGSPSQLRSGAAFAIVNGGSSWHHVIACTSVAFYIGFLNENSGNNVFDNCGVDANFVGAAGAGYGFQNTGTFNGACILRNFQCTSSTVIQSTVTSGDTQSPNLIVNGLQVWGPTGNGIFDISNGSYVEVYGFSFGQSGSRTDFGSVDSTSSLFLEGPAAYNFRNEAYNSSNIKISSLSFGEFNNPVYFRNLGAGNGMIFLRDETSGESAPNKGLKSEAGNFIITNSAYTANIVSIDDNGNATVAGSLNANGIALAVTPSVATLATNPPVSGTAYQWAGPGKLELSCPVTLNPTSSAAATATLSIGATSTPANQIDYASRPAGLTAADGEIITLRATIPAGWYYELSATNATIGTCVGVVH